MSSQTTTESSPEASMKSSSQQVLQWKKELSEWNPDHPDHDSTTQEIPQILKDSEINNTIDTAVKALSASLPKASAHESSSNNNKDTELVNAALDVLSKAAIQPTAKTRFVVSGALKPISEILRKACLSQRFVVSPRSDSSTPQQNFDEKKDDDATTSCSPTSTISNTAVATTTSCESQTTPSMALHCLANLSDNASDAIKSDYLLPIVNPLIHNVMELYLHEQTIQRYSCKMLYHLSNPLLQELVAAGFVELIWKANQAYPEDEALQHYTNACLYNLLPVCPEHVLQQTVHPQQLVQGLVPGMTANPTALEVQKFGLLVMTRIATNNKSQTHRDNQSSPTNTPSEKSSSFLKLPNSNNNASKPKDNALQASQALGLPHVISSILTALNSHCKNDEIAQVGCNLLKHVSRISIDFANAMIDRGGLPVLVRIMQCHLDHTSIQDPVMATMRNLLSLRANNAVGMVDTTTTEAAAKSIRNALQADAPGAKKGESTLAAMIRVIGLVMSIHVQDAPIQAYGCDAFGRLAALDNDAEDGENPFWIRELLFEGNALRLALQAMRVHYNHTGVQDRAVVLLLRMCSYERAYEFMRQVREKPEESDDEDEEDCEYGDEYDDGDSIGPVLSQSATKDSNASSDMPQSFVYKILAQTKVSPRKECNERLQKLLSIVDLQDMTPAVTSTRSDGTRESFSSGFFSRMNMEGASERMRNLRESLSSPTNTGNTAAASNNGPQRASWTSPLKERTGRWWQSAPAK